MNDQRGAQTSRLRRWLWKLCLAVLLLAAVAMGFRAWILRPNTVPVKPTGPGVLRVVTYNVQCRTPSADTVALLAGLDADVVFLQEVRRSQEGLDGLDQPAALRDGLNANGYYAVSYDDGHFTESQMILSCYPIRDGEVFAVPNRRSIAIAATIDVNGRPIRVYSVHLSSSCPLRLSRLWPALTQRRREAKRIAEMVDHDLAASLPVILGGDLNSSPHTSPYKVFSSFLTDCASAVGRARATLPKKFPVLRYDAILVSDHFTPLTAGEKRGPSDHLAVIVDVKLSNAPP